MSNSKKLYFTNIKKYKDYLFIILRLKTSMSVFYPKNYEDFKNKIFRNLNVTESQKINQKR